ncbi:DNA-binding protein (plasmid) [Xanthomonas campestris pv. campestris]|uniref:DNA-binding protein n=1 Tax=Xanthomonas campestris TaxID=339 RepID=UPI00236869E3|nr:DNA-binding protein [Xanthomonas campestris]MEB1409580.1 DNA-binding protein [Xanthomonas campestris pv. campestris]MEB1510788.1 DNA-binding protein [Xanthomonas campestris pv. campestris]MEB1763592.1 DNA-binding protein [Xanthomonas campestris pv. campestris]MEB1874102.1 DNA-binding protein [Xanthomonas campestris pv. campestris]MEB1909834.1 DNA-binding protein [Xanthomonas campestris pv. campestris]
MVESSRITSTEVFDAIEKLLAAGQAPTHMSVRKVLGSRGSGPVLSKFIARWFEEHGAEFFIKVDDARSRKPITDIGAQIRHAAEQAAQVLSDAERQRQEALCAREAAAEQRSVMLDAKEEALFAEQAKMAERASEQERLIHELQSDKTNLVSRLDQARLDRLQVESELRELSSAIAGVRDELGLALQEIAVSQEREQASQLALAEARHERDAASKRFERFEDAYAKILNGIHRLRESGQEQGMNLLNALQKLSERLELHQTQLDASAAELAAASHRARTLEDKLSQSETMLAAAHGEARTLSAALVERMHTIDQLRVERDAALELATSVSSSLATISRYFESNGNHGTEDDPT